MPESERPNHLRGLGINRKFCLPRLSREYYQGDAVVHWTMPIAMRRTGWLSETFHSAFRETMLHAAAREGLFCPVYCLMPDHLHLVWMGLRLDSDQQLAMKFLREHLASVLLPNKFQHLPYDHVLREEDRKRNAFAKVCQYVIENPLRAELVKNPKEWPFIGVIVPGYPVLHPLNEDFWPVFWRLYAKKRSSDAGNLKRPAV